MPALHDHHAVGLRRLFHIMRDHHDGHPAFVQFVAYAHQACSAARVEHGRSLVEHEHRRVHGKHAGDGHALLLPAGQGVGLMALESRKPHVLKRLRHAFAQLIGGDAQVLGTEGHVVFHERGNQLVVGILEHHAHRLADAVRAIGVRGGHVLHFHGALVGDEQGVQMLGQRRLAAAVAAQDAQEFALAHVQAHAVKREVCAVVGEADVLNIYHDSLYDPFMNRRITLRFAGCEPESEVARFGGSSFSGALPCGTCSGRVAPVRPAFPIRATAF